MKLPGKVRVSFERLGKAGPAPPGWRYRPKSGANSQPNECPFESLGKELSGEENRFELSLLFVENLGFENFFAIFCHFFNFSVYCRGYSSFILFLVSHLVQETKQVPQNCKTTDSWHS